ncbi:class I SAM-dependent methyltransferase [Candidatus Woesearchaeota archaeon]|nr:class I SAM-dependent methyltransferase [Candidatus Woesearchaeota archaeon]
MDEAWKKIYQENATKEIPIHTMSCWTEEGFQELFKITFKIVKKLKNIKTVLDVGCGPGEYCAEFHRKGYEITGIDYAENVIKQAQKKHPDIKFIVGNAYKLPFKDQEFDLITCIGVLQCVYEPEKIINELTRVSKKHIIISTLLRQKKLENPIRLLQKKLETDNWPTRDYHPSEIQEILEKKGYITTLILKNNKQLIKDGFFIIATKKQ